MDRFIIIIIVVGVIVVSLGFVVRILVLIVAVFNLRLNIRLRLIPPITTLLLSGSAILIQWPIGLPLMRLTES